MSKKLDQQDWMYNALIKVTAQFDAFLLHLQNSFLLREQMAWIGTVNVALKGRQRTKVKASLVSCKEPGEGEGLHELRRNRDWGYLLTNCNRYWIQLQCRYNIEATRFPTGIVMTRLKNCQMETNHLAHMLISNRYFLSISHLTLYTC